MSLATSHNPVGPDAAGVGSGAGATRWHGVVLGVELEADFPVPGLSAGGSDAGARASRLSLVDKSDAPRHWSRRGARRIGKTLGPTGRVLLAVYEHPELGHRVVARDTAEFIIKPGAHEIVCVAPRTAMWAWQRVLLGQVLPLVAALQGREVVHASAVAVDRHAVLFAGASGAGKTSLALNLALLGLPFRADDTVALELRDGRVVTYGAGGMAGVRHLESELIGDAVRDRLGEVIGHGVKTYLHIAHDSRELPLGAVYFIDRDSRNSELAFERIDAPGPMHILGMTFIEVLTSPRRKIEQLDIAATAARTVPMFRMRVPLEMGASDAAGAVAAHAIQVVAR